MSQQYPPPPPSPYGQPPMYPPGAGAGAGAYPMPPRSSGAAVASLVFGLILCIPIVTQVLAILFGVLGLKATSQPNVTGRGMAVAGLILGLIFLIGWIALGGLGYVAYGQLQRASIAEMQTVVNAIADGDSARAAAESSLTPAEIDAIGEKIRDWGKLGDVHVKIQFSDLTEMGDNKEQRLPMRGTANFSKAGEKPFRVVLTIDKNNERMRIDDLVFE